MVQSSPSTPPGQKQSEQMMLECYLSKLDAPIEINLSEARIPDLKKDLPVCQPGTSIPISCDPSALTWIRSLPIPSFSANL